MQKVNCVGGLNIGNHDGNSAISDGEMRCHAADLKMRGEHLETGGLQRGNGKARIGLAKAVGDYGQSRVVHRIQNPWRLIVLRSACSLRGRLLRSNRARTFRPRP